MKVAVVSDIHSNLPALEKFMSIAEDKYDKMWCLGDTVGYGPWPSSCLKIVKNNFDLIIQGNHDREVSNKSNSSGFNRMARQGKKHSEDVLENQELEWLSQLPEKQEVNFQGKRFLLCHSHPDKRDKYVHPEDSNTLKKYLREFDAVMTGHTHIPFIEKQESGIIANPGSIGQPRDGNPKASYLEINDEDWHIKRFEYSKKEYTNQVRKLGLPRQTAQRLFSGK